MTRITVVIGHPRAGSRTHRVAAEFAEALAHSLDGPVVVSKVDLAELTSLLLVPEDVTIAAALDKLAASDVVVLVSPTYKGTYTGLLKVFLDALPHRALANSVAVDVATAAIRDNAQVTVDRLSDLAQELGATSTDNGIAVAESDLASDEWIAGQQVLAAITQVRELLKTPVSA